MRFLSFGERLADLRKEKKVTQEDIANLLGIKRPSVSAWENQEAQPTLDKLILLSEYFQVSLDYLVGKTEFRTEISVFDSEYTVFGGRMIYLSEIFKMMLELPPAERAIAYSILLGVEKGQKHNIVSLVEFYRLSLDGKRVSVSAENE